MAVDFIRCLDLEQLKRSPGAGGGGGSGTTSGSTRGSSGASPRTAKTR